MLRRKTDIRILIGPVTVSSEERDPEQLAVDKV